MNKNEENLNNVIGELHKKIVEIENSNEYIIGRKIAKINFIKKLYKSHVKRIEKKYPVDFKQATEYIVKDDYSNLKNKKIVVYTCITGDYDEIEEPLYCSENVKYVLFTNNKKIKSKKWTIVYLENKEKFNNVLLNRYVKMHPFEFFKDYDYSIYIDGNIKIYSDLSCYINRINQEFGFAFNIHSCRNKLSSEIAACKILKKGNIEKLKKQIDRYYSDGMPDDYGLLEANVILYDLKSKLAKNIFENWWNEFKTSESGRDQIALPYVLYKNNILIKSVGTLGNNVRLDPKIEIKSHK